MWSCLYITDRGAEEYESYGSIVDPQSGICDLCDRWIFSSASEFEPITDYGILKERFCALATDGIRAKILEEQGYDTQILEFIDMEHTPKNLLIRAIHRKKQSDKKKEKAAQQVDAFCKQFGFTPTLWKLLQEEGEEGGTHDE